MKPWHDVPRCSCGGPLVAYDLRREGRLRCCACGQHTHGTDEQVERAKRADAAYDEHRAGWSTA